MKVLGINHLAIAHDKSGNLEKVLKILGLHPSKSEEVSDQKVRVEFFPLKSPNFSFELLTPLSEDSVIQKYLDSKGSGLHHFCLEVDNIDEVSNLLREEKVQLIYPEAKLGAHGAKINFIHPKASGGILIEIAEYK